GAGAAPEHRPVGRAGAGPGAAARPSDGGGAAGAAGAGGGVAGGGRGGARGGGGPPPFKETVLAEAYYVLITCRDEKQQVDLLGRFKGEGLTCKAILS